jgi:hypothetical protein
MHFSADCKKNIFFKKFSRIIITEEQLRKRSGKFFPRLPEDRGRE